MTEARTLEGRERGRPEKRVWPQGQGPTRATRACRHTRTFDCMPPRPARDLPVRSGPLPSWIPSKAMVRMRFAFGSARGSALYTPSTLDMSISRSDPEDADSSDAKQSLSLREMLPTSLAPGVTKGAGKKKQSAPRKRTRRRLIAKCPGTHSSTSGETTNPDRRHQASQGWRRSR